MSFNFDNHPSYGALGHIPVQPLGGTSHAMDLSLIQDLDTSALYRLADYYERTVRQVRLQISERKKKETSRQLWEKKDQEIDQAVIMVASWIKNGVPYERALLKINEVTGFRLDTLEMRYKYFIKGQKEMARNTRDITVMRLARSGLTNIAIAQKLEISRNLVSRIIHKALKTD